MDFEMWIYRGLIGLLLLVIWWVVRRWANQISTKFDELIKVMTQIGEKTVNQEVRIKTLEKRTDDHAIRIRNIEIKK